VVFSLQASDQNFVNNSHLSQGTSVRMRNVLCYELVYAFRTFFSGVHKTNTTSWFSVSERFIYETPQENLIMLSIKSRDSSVGIALGYGLDDRGSRIRFPAGAGNFSLHHRVQNGSETHPASYPVGTRVSFPGGKAAGAWCWPLTSI
jgi:hypothetical protein